MRIVEQCDSVAYSGVIICSLRVQSRARGEVGSCKGTRAFVRRAYPASLESGASFGHSIRLLDSATNWRRTAIAV